MTLSPGPASPRDAPKKRKANSRKALAEGTRDARLMLHAGLISAALAAPEASEQLAAAQAARQTLLPSERTVLDRALAAPLSKK